MMTDTAFALGALKTRLQRMHRLTPRQGPTPGNPALRKALEYRLRALALEKGLTYDEVLTRAVRLAEKDRQDEKVYDRKERSL